MLFGGPGGDIRPEFVAALSQELQELRRRHPERPEAQVWAPQLPLHMLSTGAPEDFAQELYQQIEREIAKRGDVESIVLLGYSCGAVLARRIFCLAHGMGADARYFREPSPWAHKIDRVVTLSGITRGWEFSSATPAWMRFFGPALKSIVSFGAGIRDLFSSARLRDPFIWQMKRGSP